MRMGRRGFSLLEMMCAVAIMVAVLAVLTLSSGSVRTGARQSAAGLVETELRSARERALGEQKFVAVVMQPGTGSDLGIEAGRNAPRRERLTSLAREFRGAWVKTGALATPPPADPRVAAAWLEPSRAAVVFTPSGRMLSNLVPDATGRIVLECGSSAAAETVLTIDPGGAVTSELKAGSARGTLAAPMQRVEGANRPPRFESFELNTSATVKRVDGILHADIDPGKRLNVHVYATDPDGDEQLFCRWTGGGSFSQPGRAPMLLDPTTGKWNATVTWQAPNPLTGVLTLRCEITDRHGEPALTPAGGLAADNDDYKLLIGDPVAERIVLPMDVHEHYASICVMNPDGSGFRPIWAGTPAEVADDVKAQETTPVVSPDGRQLLYVNCKNWPPDLIVRNIDGTNRREFCRDWDQPGFGHLAMFWSATGDSIYYTRAVPGATGQAGELVRVKADCSNAVNPSVVTGGLPLDHAFVSPNGKLMVWSVFPGGSWSDPVALELVDLESGQKALVATASATLDLTYNCGINYVHWLPDSAGFLFACEENGQAKIKRGTATFPPTEADLTNVAAQPDQIAVSPNGKLAYTTNRGRSVYLHGTVTAPASQGGPVMQVSSNYIYTTSPHRIMWSRDGRYLFYVQSPIPNSKILRYDTEENSVLELRAGLGHPEPATSTAGGATDFQLLPDL